MTQHGMPHCTGALASAYPKPTGLTGAGPSVQLILHPLVQFIAVVIWTPKNILSLFFHYGLSVSAVEWTHLYGELDTFDFIHGTYKSYKYDLTNLLDPLIMLSHNHQNHKQ